MNRSLLPLLLAMTVGCVPQGTQPTSGPVVASPSRTVELSARASAPTVSSASPASALGPIRFHRLPEHREGQWSAWAAIDATRVLVALIPGRPPANDAERLQFVSELAVLNIADGSVRSLVRLQAGNTVYGPILAGNSVAWIETSAVDLRAYGWKLHLTDVATGDDRVVATDPGGRLAGDDSVIPSFAYDGASLAFTVLGSHGGTDHWLLRLSKDGNETTIAELANPTKARINRVTVNSGVIAWVEAAHEPPSQVLAVRSVEGAISRRPMQLDAIYQIELRGGRIYLATGRGVFETDAANGAPAKVSPGEWAVDQMSVLAGYLVYRAFDPAESVFATQIGSHETTTLATGITSGPRSGNGVLIFTKRGTDPSAPHEIGVLGG